MKTNLLNHGNLTTELSGRAMQWLRKLEVLQAVDSTNSRMMSLAAAESVQGNLLVSTNQTQGRGRHGRQWLAQPDQAIAMSMGFEFRRHASELQGLSLVVGLALLDALQSLGVQKLALKWPNDLLLGGAKLAGILIETVTRGEWLCVVVGLGINLQGAQALSARLNRQIADLSCFEKCRDPNRLAGCIVASVVTYLAAFDEHGFAPMRVQWQQHHAFQDQKLVVQQGDRKISGLAVGVSDQGELLLKTETGMQKISAGEVSID